MVQTLSIKNFRGAAILLAALFAAVTTVHGADAPGVMRKRFCIGGPFLWSGLEVQAAAGASRGRRRSRGGRARRSPDDEPGEQPQRPQAKRDVMVRERSRLMRAVPETRASRTSRYDGRTV
jgi:hypothetical protein